MKQAYILVVDINAPTPFNSVDFCSKLKSNAFLFEDWWHYLPGTFILISGGFGHSLTQSLRTILGNRSHILLKADLYGASGMLQPDAWNWINSRSLTTKHFPY